MTEIGVRRAWRLDEDIPDYELLSGDLVVEFDDGRHFVQRSSGEGISALGPIEPADASGTDNLAEMHRAINEYLLGLGGPRSN